MIIRLVRCVLLTIVSSFALSPSSAFTAQDAQRRQFDMPHNIRVSPMLQPVFAMLLQKSETFRRQCERIGRARHVRVSVTSAPPQGDRSLPRARASITRHLHGLVKAVVEIPVSPDMVELLPHEFEHVIEQIEGVDLAGLAAMGAGGVLELEPGVFETARARSAGLAVMRELFGHADPALSSAARRFTRALRLIRPAAGPAVPGARRDAPVRPRINRIYTNLQTIEFTYPARFRHTLAMQARLIGGLVVIRSGLPGVDRRKPCG